MRTEHQTINVFTTLGKAGLTRLVTSSRSVSHVFEQLQLRKSGAAFKIFRRVAQELEVDTSHFKTYGDQRCREHLKRPLENIFREGSTVCNATLRNKVIRHRLKPYQCEKCPNTGEWLGSPIVLQLDHVNGIRDDNRIENLRFLCPNCHSQTETFCGRKAKVQPRCPDCGKAYKGAGRRCRRCSIKLVKRTCSIQWPSSEALGTLVWEKTLSSVSKDLHCSDTALRKHLKRNGIPSPPMGYWERRHSGYTHEESLVSQKRVRQKARRLAPEQTAQARRWMAEGCSLREAARRLGFCHQALLRALAK